VTRRTRTVVSLFSGIGGLDAGLEASGFEVAACVEKDPVARRVLGELHPSWNLLREPDVCLLNPRDVFDGTGLRKGELTLLAGGPPCQPFSRARAWAGPPPGREDPQARTIPAFFRLARELAPKVLLLENVPGLATAAEKYLLRKVHEVGRHVGEPYSVSTFSLQAADYGVPQRRRRFFLVAVRDGAPFRPPATTHSKAADVGRRIEPFRTSWDAIGHLDGILPVAEMMVQGQWAGLLPSIPEGSNYLHHTRRGGGVSLFGWRTRFWSFLLKLAKNEPSWTLSATPGPATGPFHWRSRRLSISEMAAIQTIPLPFVPRMSLMQAQRLIGNAVPSLLGEILGLEIRRQVLKEPGVRIKAALIPSARVDCPAPTPLQPVPACYDRLVGPKDDHPGPGKGPAHRAKTLDVWEPAA
jgi:DNA (cytosine-5)-methyltransferase 1